MRCFPFDVKLLLGIFYPWAVLSPTQLSNTFSYPQVCLNTLSSNYVISTKVPVSGCIGSNAFRLILERHRLPIRLPYCLLRFIRSLIKQEKKSNKLTLVLQCPPSIPQVQTQPFIISLYFCPRRRPCSVDRADTQVSLYLSYELSHGINRMGHFS